MISLKVVSLITCYAFTASAQLIYDPQTNGFNCVVPKGSFCAGDSLSTDIIVYCKDGVGVVADCCVNWQDPNAQCYQTSTSAGDAACASNGTAYPVSGSKFPIPPAPAGKNNTTPGVPAVIAKGDDQCECATPQNKTHPPMPPYPSSPVSPVKNSPVPPPGNPPLPPPTTPVGAVLSSTSPPGATLPGPSGYPNKPSSSVKPSSSYTSSQLPSNWSPTPSPTPTTTSSPVKGPTYTGAAIARRVGAEIFAVAGFAALLL